MSARAFWRVASTPRMLTLFVLLSLAAVACGLLGSWQLDQAEVRGARAAEEARQAVLGAEPVPIGELVAPGQAFSGDFVGRRVIARGEFTGVEFLVEGRVREGEVGHLVLAEMRVTDDGTGAGELVAPVDAPVLAVVRGWVPDAAAGVPPAPSGVTSVTGYLQVGEGAGTGLASDGSVLPEGQTDAISMAQLAGEWGTPIYTGYLVQSDPDPAAPLAALGPPALPGSGVAWRNLMYALQWWIFGGFALTVWVRSVRDEARDAVASSTARTDGQAVEGRGGAGGAEGRDDAGGPEGRGGAGDSREQGGAVDTREGSDDVPAGDRESRSPA